MLEDEESNINFSIDYFEHIPTSIDEKYKGFSTYFQSQFEKFAQDLDLGGYSEFEYQINFIVSSDSSLNQITDFLISRIDVNILFEGNIDKKVFRVLKKSLIINTIHFKTGEVNKYYVNLGFFSGQEVTFSGWSTIELHNIIFVNRDSIPYNFLIKFVDMF